MKIYNPTVEERAFLYQEAQDLEPLIKDLGSLSVMVEESQNRYRVTFMVAPESMGMRVQAVDRNIYDAAMAAKEEAVRQLNAILNAMPRQWHINTGASGMPLKFLH